jgi:tetratricopeptide (TPR) repeat protein
MLFRVLILGSRHKKAMANLSASSARLATHNRMMEAYRLGDYESALREAEFMKDSNKAGYFFFRGVLLTELGRFEEAEELLRKNVLIESRTHQSALGYSSLGHLMLERDRYEEALECFSSSLRHMPDRGATHRDVAETWLKRGNNSSEALKWAQLAVEKERAGPVLSAEVRDSNLGENLATLAWAVAVSSRDRQAVDRLLAEAVPMVKTLAVSTAAQVHYHAGRTCAELGDTAKSEEYFQEASHGRWGRAARAALQHANQ